MSSLAFEAQPDILQLIEEIHALAGAARPGLVVVLGSGWGDVVLGELLGEFAYADYPGFPKVSVQGHSGCLKVVRSGSETITVFAGRFHCYQGLSAYEASFPARFAAALGCRRLLLTCATGGVNPEFRPGDFMYLADHINLLGDNPLRGGTESLFVDLSELYNQALYPSLSDWAAGVQIPLHQGVLAAMPGPSYETPAEIRMLAALGADVVSMSMVPEAIMARSLGLSVVGLAHVANAAAGLGEEPITHQDVLSAAAASSAQAESLLLRIISTWLNS